MSRDVKENAQENIKTEKKTPLYDVHVEEGGKIVPFGGYLLPVQYKTGVIAEHKAVREKAGLFDVSHMGEITVSGSAALEALNHLLTNDFTDMQIGRVRYSVMCNADGGCVDDVVVYKFGEESYLIVVNAANKDKDFAHIAANLVPGAEAQDISESVAQLALQGPASADILAGLVTSGELPQKYYTAAKDVYIDGMECMISRTGYTGEFGYEIYTAAENAEKLWKALRKAGGPYGLIPAGLGARDTLRLEASMPLYGHELNDEISPIEAGLASAVKMNKSEFIGKEALIARGEPQKVRVGLKATGRGIIREHQDIYIGDEKVGITTSGTFCPHIDCAVAMAMIDADKAAVGTALEADVRGRRIAAEIVPMPFYKRAK